MMTAEEFVELKRDIQANGQLMPIWILNDKIVDGRNRYQACVDLGIEPLYQTVPGHPDMAALLTFVISLNEKRRHLNSGQKAFVALEVERILAEEAKKRQGARADLKPRTLQDGITEYWADELRKRKAIRESTLGKSLPNVDSDERKASDQAAKIVGTNRLYVTDAKKIEREAPELKEAVMAGTMTLPQARHQLKEREREARRDENRKIIQSVPEPAKIIEQAKFATIVIDPPWDWSDEGDQDQLGRARPDYATMTIDELERLQVAKLADIDCHLYLWITNRSLPKGFRLLEAWGFRYITALTWVKPHFGMGNYFRGQTEHVLFGVKGSQPLKRKDVGTVFMADRGPDGHSSKPPSFLELVESCSPGPYLEMFSRSNRDGWTAWGENTNER